MRASRNRYARLAASRTLHLLDVENLLAGDVDPDGVSRLWERYTRSVEVGVHDAVFAAFCPATAPGALGLPIRARVLVGAVRHDSADIALGQVMDPAFVTSRFGRVVIGSGDHYFARSVKRIRAAGLPVVAVLGPSKIAASLYCACSDSVRLAADASALTLAC